MVKTLINDAFGDDEQKAPETVITHNIVYGALGYTDALDDATIADLVRVGVILLDRTVAGSGTLTTIYRSTYGNPPPKE